MIDYQPVMCVAEIREIRNEPDRYNLMLFSEVDERIWSWNVSGRYLEYLSEYPAVPLCPLPDW